MVYSWLLIYSFVGLMIAQDLCKYVAMLQKQEQSSVTTAGVLAL
jgi:hypothetical protein